MRIVTYPFPPTMTPPNKRKPTLSADLNIEELAGPRTQPPAPIRAHPQTENSDQEDQRTVDPSGNSEDEDDDDPEYVPPAPSASASASTSTLPGDRGPASGPRASFNPRSRTRAQRKTTKHLPHHHKLLTE